MAWRRGILQKLHDMGIRGNLPIFIKNLISNRTFRVRIGSTLSDLHMQENGVPQGSAISPTLFMLLINDILEDTPSHIRYSLYADDIAIWSVHPDINMAKIGIQNTLDKISRWQDKWGTRFSPNKSNYILFTYKKIIPTINLTIKGEPIPEAKSTFFLGMNLDSKLKWNKHIQYLADACNKRLNVLRSIQNHNWGADMYSMVKFYKAFIRAKMDYGCHLYDAAAKTNKKILNTIQNNALRIATGGLHNTQKEFLEAETDVIPLQLHREYHSINYGVKIIADTRHPTRPFLTDHEKFMYSNDKSFGRRLHELGNKYNKKIKEVDNRCDFNIPPWVEPSFNIDLSIHNGTKDQTPVEILRAKSLETINKYTDTTHYYTDGSVHANKTGMGLFNNTYSECWRLPDNTTIYTAEAFAIFRAIRHGLKNRRNITIFTDSLSCLIAIQHYQTEHSIITRILNMLHYTSQTVNLCWIPSHCNVLGNEQADRIAKRSLELNTIKNINIPRKEFMKAYKILIYNQWQRQYDLLDKYKIKEKLGIWETSYQINRYREVKLARLRMGCVKFIHLTPHIQGTHPVVCNCDGSFISLNHIFFNCNYYTNQRLPLINMLIEDDLNLNLRNLLANNEDFIDEVFKFLNDTNLMKEL